MTIRTLRGVRSYGDGTLHSHLLLELTGAYGDAAAAFVGPCRVSVEGLVDQEDRRRASPIAAERMLHFVVEHFDRDLVRAVLRQRLLVALVREALPPAARLRVTRRGDDLWVGRRKLSVSIATTSPVSSLIHVGVNLDARGAPIRTAELPSLGVREPRRFAGKVLAAYRDEQAGVARAAVKVRATL